MNILFFLHPKNDVAFIYNHNSVQQGLEKMCKFGYTALPVINKAGIYIGTVSEGDFLRHMLENNSCTAEAYKKHKISGIIRPGWNPAVRVSVTMDELLLQVMEQNFLPVVDDRGCFMGIITRKDVIKYFYELNQKQNNITSHIAV